MLRTPWLVATLLFASGFVLLVIGPIEVLLPFITQERFENGEQIYGFVLAAYGVGGAIGALAVSSGRLPRRYMTVMMLCWGLGNLPLVVLGYSSSFPLMAGAAFVVGITDSAAMVIWGTLPQRRRHRDARPGVKPGLLCLAGVYARVDGGGRTAVQGDFGRNHLPGGGHNNRAARGGRPRRGADATRRVGAPR